MDVAREAFIRREARTLWRKGQPALVETEAEDLRVEAQFIAKVIADAGHIGMGAVGDFLDRGGLITALGEDLARGIEKGLTGIAGNRRASG
jgi:hypothetical protein